VSFVNFVVVPWRILEPRRPRRDCGGAWATGILSPLPGLVSVLEADPRLTPWAIVCRCSAPERDGGSGWQAGVSADSGRSKAGKGSRGDAETRRMDIQMRTGALTVG
jgi:hypothetical protein